MRQLNSLPLRLFATGALLVSLAACSTGGTTDSGNTGTDSDEGPDGGTIAESIDCEAIRTAMGDSFENIDPSGLPGVSELPAGTISSGCHIANEAGGVLSLIPDPDGSLYGQLAAGLEANGYQLDDSANTGNAHSFYGDSQVNVFDGLTAETETEAGLPDGLLDSTTGPLLMVLTSLS